MPLNDLNIPDAISVATPEAFREIALEMARNAKHHIVIYTPDLEPSIYNHTPFVDTALQLIKRSKHTSVRVLAQDTKSLIENEHKLLKIHRYADQQFYLKKLSVKPVSITPAYMICDDHSMLRRQNSDLYQGMYYRYDRARVKDQLEEFDRHWSAAVPDRNLKQLTI